MKIEKYTERAQGFVQSAQQLALSSGHQQFTPLHLLKILLDDEEGLAAGLVDRAGGNSIAVKGTVQAALKRVPQISGGGDQLYLSRDIARVFDTAEKAALRARDSFVTVERLLLALAISTIGNLRNSPSVLLGDQQAPVAAALVIDTFVDCGTQASSDFGSLILAVVCDYDQPIVGAELKQNCLDRLANACLLVMCGDEDCQWWPVAPVGAAITAQRQQGQQTLTT